MNEGAKPDVQTMEQEVRRRWEYVELVECAANCWVIVGTRSLDFRHAIRPTGETAGEAWSAAYAFTLAHAQKIAELREEIEQERYHIDIYHHTQAKTRESWARSTLERLESALQELLRG